METDPFISFFEFPLQALIVWYLWVHLGPKIMKDLKEGKYKGLKDR